MDAVVDHHIEWLCGVVGPGVELLIRYSFDGTTTPEEYEEALQIAQTWAQRLTETLQAHDDK